MNIKLLAIILTVTYCQGNTSIIILEPEFRLNGPECSSIVYSPGVDQEISLTITITNNGSDKLPAPANDLKNFEVRFYVARIPDGVIGHENQETGEGDSGGYMHMPTSVFAVTSGSLNDDLTSRGTVTASGTANIRAPKDYCSHYTQLCVSLVLTETALAEGAKTQRMDGGNQNGKCKDFGCSPEVIGTLDCGTSGSGDTRTMTSLVVSFLVFYHVFVKSM